MLFLVNANVGQVCSLDLFLFSSDWKTEPDVGLCGLCQVLGSLGSWACRTTVSSAGVCGSGSWWLCWGHSVSVSPHHSGPSKPGRAQCSRPFCLSLRSANQEQGRVESRGSVTSASYPLAVGKPLAGDSSIDIHYESLWVSPCLPRAACAFSSRWKVMTKTWRPVGQPGQVALRAGCSWSPVHEDFYQVCWCNWSPNNACQYKVLTTIFWLSGYHKPVIKTGPMLQIRCFIC